MCILGDTLQPPQDVNPALSHLFRLRKIQASIRRSKENWRRSPLIKHDTSHNSSSSFKSALDIWRQEIPRYGSNNVQYGYLHPIWMRKLYDYSLLILMEGKRNFVEDGVEEFLAAIVDVCLNFRILQEEGHVMCYTWSAVCNRRLILIHRKTWLTFTFIACLPVSRGNHAFVYCLGNKIYD
jgi:hypothetical protein